MPQATIILSIENYITDSDLNELYIPWIIEIYIYIYLFKTDI